MRRSTVILLTSRPILAQADLKPRLQSEYDILPAVPRGIALLLVDATLALYTHHRPVVRRAALAALLAAQMLVLWSLFRDPAATSTGAISRLSFQQNRPSKSAADLNAALYVPVPPSPSQELEYQRLRTLIDSKTSSYAPELFAPGSYQGVPVTAVLLHWKRRRGLGLVVEQLSRYPYIREIIIWNNRGVDLIASVSPRLYLSDIIPGLNASRVAPGF